MPRMWILLQHMKEKGRGVFLPLEAGDGLIPSYFGFLKGSASCQLLRSCGNNTFVPQERGASLSVADILLSKKRFIFSLHPYTGTGSSPSCHRVLKMEPLLLFPESRPHKGVKNSDTSLAKESGSSDGDA